VLVNLQKRYAVRAATLSAFVRQVKRRLRLGETEFNICFVEDAAIRRLNLAYRGKDKATDVLSFPWNETDGPPLRKSGSAFRRGERAGLKNFLGEVVISVETARRNAGAEGHSTQNEIRWLILHGVLHLLGYDHEQDNGQMAELELGLREELCFRGKLTKKQGKRQKVKVKSPLTSPAPTDENVGGSPLSPSGWRGKRLHSDERKSTTST